MGFNGATAFQPWKLLTFGGSEARDVLLQWGHGFSAVEIRSRPPNRPDRAGFNGATAFQPWKLDMSQSSDLAVLGFNGATAFQPWKCDNANQFASGVDLLQWGHGFSAVEILRPVLLHRLHDHASMGPRLFSRGNVARKYLHWSEQSLLQWGHGFSAVEMVDHVLHDPAGLEASMGPRLFSRGNRPLQSQRRYGKCGFNGATAFQPWKLDEEDFTWQTLLLASMGPRLFSRGNGHNDTTSATAGNGFNGATAFQPWKCHEAAGDGCGEESLQWGHGFSAVEIHGQVGDNDHAQCASMGPRLFSRGNGWPRKSFRGMYLR